MQLTRARGRRHRHPLLPRQQATTAPSPRPTPPAPGHAPTTPSPQQIHLPPAGVHDPASKSKRDRPQTAATTAAVPRVVGGGLFDAEGGREGGRERSRASNRGGLIKGSGSVTSPPAETVAFAWREGGRRRRGEARWAAEGGEAIRGEAFDSLVQIFKCGFDDSFGRL